MVICAHALEHCLDLQRVIEELKRVCRGQLIIIVPKQRPFLYTLDEHVQFFFYEEQLTWATGLQEFQCFSAGGDWFYCGRQIPSLSRNPSK